MSSGSRINAFGRRRAGTAKRTVPIWAAEKTARTESAKLRDLPSSTMMMIAICQANERAAVYCNNHDAIRVAAP